MIWKFVYSRTFYLNRNNRLNSLAVFFYSSSGNLLNLELSFQTVLIGKF